LLCYRCDSQITADTSRPLILTSTSTYVGFASLGVSQTVQFSLRIRTRSTTGLIVHCAGQTHPVADRVLLRLSGGRPRLTVNWGSGPLLVQSLVEVSDGRWHSLEVIVETSTASLFVDGRRFDRRAHYFDATVLNLATYFYVGAFPEALTQRRATTLDSLRGGSKRGIIGCVDRVRIHGRPESWRTVVASSPHAATECTSSLFTCNRTRSICSVTDAEKHSVDETDFSPNMTSVSVVEGGRLALSTDLIRFVSDETILRPDIRFRAAANQLHGHLTIADREPDGDEIEFSSSDLAQSRVWYVHDGSETTSDEIRLYAEKAAADEELVLPINVIPANDAPVIRLPPNDTLTLVSNTKIKLNTELLSAMDPDDVSSSVEFSVYPSDQDSGYFELAASSGVRAQITRFTQRDIEAGHVFYVHRGSASHFLLMGATDRKDASEVKRLNVVGLPLAVFPDINTGSSVPRGGNVIIRSDMLSFATNAPYLPLDIRYQVIEPPFYGELQKWVQYRPNNHDDDTDNRMWIVSSSFTQTQLYESRVRYIHNQDATSREDYFLFRVSAVGAGQRAETDVEYHFRLTVVDCIVTAAANKPVFLQAVGRDQVITSGTLRYVSNLPQHSPRDVIYRVRSAPRFGDLLVGRDLDRKWNQRRRRLTSGDSFTQADVDNGRLAYRMYTTTGAANDTIELDFTTHCSSRRRHKLSLQYRPTTGNARLINVGLTHVQEGGSALIVAEMLSVEIIDDQGRHNFTFSISEPTRHGVLQLMKTGSRSSAVSKVNPTAFSVEDIVSGRLRYVHDDSETKNDSFHFTVSENVSGDVTSEPEVVFRGRFAIDITLQNDNVPKRVNEAKLDVVFGVGGRLGPEHLKYVDADVDTTRLDFTWKADSEAVELVMTVDRWAPLYHFTQADVDAGRVYVQHYGGTENVVVIWVSDGLHFVTDSLVVRASEPFVRAGNGSGLTVVAGQSAVVSAASVGFTTNIDADLADIVFQVSTVLHTALCTTIIIFPGGTRILTQRSLCINGAQWYEQCLRYDRIRCSVFNVQ